MPLKPLRPCRYPGCGVLTVEPFCIRHEQQDKKERSNWSTKTPKERGYGNTWVKLRKLIMLRDGGICQVCLAKGIVKEAKEVDHIIPKVQGGTDEDKNLQAICTQCHQQKTAIESSEGQRTSYYPDWLPKPKCRVTIVCGPPGAGKTTYCKQLAGKHDLIIDVDEIAAKLTGKPMYEASLEEMSQAIRVRNKMLADLANPQYNRCWFITTGKYEDRREWWKAKLNAELVLLDTDKRTCIDRIKADNNRSEQAKKRAIETILGWQ